MAKPTLQEKNALIMRFHQADAVHPKNGEKIDISNFQTSYARP